MTETGSHGFVGLFSALAAAVMTPELKHLMCLCEFISYVSSSIILVIDW